MNLEQEQATQEKSLAELKAELSELKAKKAEMLEFGQIDKGLNGKIEDLEGVVENQELIEKGGKMLEKVGGEINADSKANILFHESQISGLERGIEDKIKKLDAARLEEANLYGKEISMGDKKTAEETADFLRLKIKKENNNQLIENLEKQIKKDKEAIENHKKIIEAQEAKVA